MAFKGWKWLVAGGIAAALFAPAGAQSASSGRMAASTLAQQLDRGLSSVEGEVIGAAEAMPESKYNFAPDTAMGNFAGVRTFAQEVKHIAVSNYTYGAAILGTKPPVALGPGENGPDNLQTKAQILELLQDSFAYDHKAIASITSANAFQPATAGGRGSRMITAIGIPSHCMDHYGQMVEYLRMNGLTPPASAHSVPANPGHAGAQP